jgi:NADH-quinone oxidoreductase subunit L
MASWFVILTILLPWTGAIIVWQMGLRRATDRFVPGAAVFFALLTVGTAVALLTETSTAVLVNFPLGSQFGDLTFVADGLAITLTLIAAGVGSLAVIFSLDYMRGEADLGRYYALILIFIGAMAGLVLTNSLLFLFFFWEITALCSYGLISFYHDDPKAVAGGIKALIVTQVGGLGLLSGALLAYAYSGSYDINLFLAEAQLLPTAVLSAIAFGFLAAAAAKSAQFPFHSWLPDAMEAPTPISALIHAATMVNAGVYLLARFYPAFYEVAGWTTAVILVGLISALMAGMMALASHDLKRVLAYSTVSQLGLMVYAVGIGAIFAGQFHLLSHALFKALLFLGAGAIIHAVGTRDMRQMGGLGATMPVTRLLFIIGALALAGIPLFNGFWSKELILEEGLAHGPLWAYVGILLAAGLTAAYSLRLVWLVFFGRPRTDHAHVHEAGPAMRVALFTLAGGTLLSWLAAGPLSSLTQTTLPYHPLHALTTGEMMVEIVTAPATLLALLVVAVGGMIWWRYNKRPFAIAPQLHQAAANDFGFDWLNGRIVTVFQGTAALWQRSQTGQLNLNAAAIVVALAVVLLLLML